MKWPLFVTQLCNVSVVSSSNDIVMIYQFMLAVFSNKFFITYSRYVNYLFKSLPYKPIIHNINCFLTLFFVVYLQDINLAPRNVNWSSYLEFRSHHTIAKQNSFAKKVEFVKDWVMKSPKSLFTFADIPHGILPKDRHFITNIWKIWLDP